MPTDPLSSHQLKRVLLDQVADKWSLLILTVLCEDGGKARFNAIKRRIAGVSQRSLAHALRGLQRNGLVRRVILPTKPPGVEYQITPLGHSLERPFLGLEQWAEANHAQVAAAQARFDGEEHQSMRSIEGMSLATLC